ncbi:hypothetical protein ILUMI_22675 [Ignelater luminosus]|uniref:Uncharacterized protein n=1 Tax=Ignelater luminosus TaxID=2038154 RepID=A0A8K0CDX3_IGNLU|nr:hypothetical protein ILUMI_22675 [Ignelater luminosus]
MDPESPMDDDSQNSNAAKKAKDPKDPKCTKTAEEEAYIKKNAIAEPPIVLACDYFKENVIDCYKRHPSHSIKCNKQVEAFETCVKGQVAAFLLKTSKLQPKTSKPNSKTSKSNYCKTKK